MVALFCLDLFGGVTSWSRRAVNCLGGVTAVTLGDARPLSDLKGFAVGAMVASLWSDMDESEMTSSVKFLHLSVNALDWRRWLACAVISALASSKSSCSRFALRERWASGAGCV